MERRTAEQIIVFLYSIYALALMVATTVLGWPGWITPITSVGIVTVWIVYLKEIRDYRFRALLYSAVVLATFALYNTQETSFGGILITYCAAIVVLSLLDIPEIVVPEYLFSVLLIAYHLLIGHTIPLGTLQEKIRSFIQILSLFAVVGITHHLIKKHETAREHMRQMIAELEEAERSKTDFLANVSHEFRTPVNAVCGASEMILQEEIPDSVRENVLHIQTAGRNLLSMVTDVLDFSELESGKMALVEEPYHLTSTINDVINMVTADTAAKGLELMVDCDADIPDTLVGDERKLRRVILNLLDNAVKFTQAGCVTLVISARPEQYGVNLCVKVKDTGIGIAEENLEKLFSGFNQADTGRARHTGGIGIGLPISKKLVTKMNGFISVRSEPGKGSEFQFVVPQKVANSRPIAAFRGTEGMHIVFYSNTESGALPEVRDNYIGNVCHMMENLGVRYHLCRNLGELKRRTEKTRYTHALITQEEYLEDPVYFSGLSGRLKLILVQGRDAATVPVENVIPLQKPFYVLSFAAALNSGCPASSPDGSIPGPLRRFTAPEASVLVVDDNLMNLKVAEGLLRPYRIRVTTASGGSECLEKLEQLRCDMIFMDHMMPELDGVETTRRIRKKAGSYFRDVPIVALTANAVDGAREMFLEEGFQDYISKPIEAARLERVLRRLLPEKKLIWEEAAAPAESTAAPPPAQTAGLIDRDKGIRNMGGDPKDYEDVLQVYLDEGRDVLRQLEKLYQATDWKNYAIYVHSLKSNSLGIGADRLGQGARDLEAACKAGDVAYIQAHHADVLRLYGEVLAEIAGTPAGGLPTAQAVDDTRPAVTASGSSAEGRDPV